MKITIGSLTEWPNKLGFDAGDVEIWKHKDAFRVISPERTLRVLYAVTTNPLTAVSLCLEQGLLVAELEELDPREADRRYIEHVPAQKELF